MRRQTIIVLMTMLVIGSAAQVNIWEGTRVKKRGLLTP